MLAITYDYVRICIIFSLLDNYLLLKLIIHRKQSAFEGLVVVKTIFKIKVYRVLFFRTKCKRPILSEILIFSNIPYFEHTCSIYALKSINCPCNFQHLVTGSLGYAERRNYHLNDKFRRAVPTFVIAGIAVISWHVDGSPTAVRALAPDMRTMPILPPTRVTTLRHGGLVRCQIQQRLLLVVTRKIILCPAPIGRTRWLSSQRGLQHTLLPF